MNDAVEMSWIDYTIFILMLILSTGFGLYHGIRRNKSNTVEEYLFGGRNISTTPLILSNMASAVSSIAIVAMSRETYYYGLQVLFIPIGFVSGFACFYFFFIPVFYELKYTSYFEYLEKRFNKAIRLLGSAVYSISQIIYALIIMYSSCTAVTKVIPIPFYLLTTIVCWLCPIYTLMGGLRGVVWSDFIQALFMYGSITTIIIISIQNVGGVSRVIDIANEGGRLQFLNLDPNPFSRYSSWSLLIVSLTTSLQVVCTNAGIIQRCLSIPIYKKVKIMDIIFYSVIISSAAATFIMLASSVTIGLLIYTTYYNCDPVLNKELIDADQLVTHHVLKIARNLPGLSGLFLAGILSASLSSLSTILNSLSGIIFEDFVKTYTPSTLNNARANVYMKLIVILLALIVNGGIFVLDPSVGLFQMAVTMLSLIGGLVLFIITFGLFVRNANTKAVIIGALAGLSITLWLTLGSMWAVTSGKIKYTTKIISTEGCIGNITHQFANFTIGSPHDTSVRFDDDVPYLYRISYTLFTAIGIIVSFIVGILITLCTKHDKNIDEKLLIPQIRRKAHVYDFVLCTDIENNS